MCFLPDFLLEVLTSLYNEYLFCLNIYEIEVAIPRPPVLLMNYSRPCQLVNITRGYECYEQFPSPAVSYIPLYTLLQSGVARSLFRRSLFRRTVYG